MDRVFLAIIVSGLLLAAAATSLFVATSGESWVAELSAPAAPIRPSPTVRRRPDAENRASPRDDQRSEGR
jgi:hypothetical protein